MTKKKLVESFAASLGTPATILFALGILLPMIIGSLLPMMTIGGLDIDLASTQTTSSDQASWTGGFILSVLLMDVVFPVIAFVYARSILARRPGVHTVSQGEKHENRARRASVSLLVMVSFAVLSYLTLTYLTFWGIEASLAALLFLLGTGLGIGYYLYGPREGSALSVESLERLEDQMPDMLFQLGSRLSEGQALERAMEDVARSMDGTEMGEFLARAVGRMKRSGQALSVAILSPDEGILVSYPSRKLFGTMKLVIDSAEKDPQAAGRTMISMSNHMRDLANTDREMRLRLRSTVDSMRSTALLFAPVIMGVTIGLYSLLGRTFGDVNGGDIIPVPLFIMLIGVYLMFSVATIIYFCTGIEKGRSKTEMSRQIGMAIPLATTIFCAIALGALMMFG